MPELQSLGVQELEGHPGVEYGYEHCGDDDAGSGPADGLPSAPLLHGTGIAQDEQATIEIIGGGEVRLHQRPCRLVGGIEDVGQQQCAHEVDQHLHLAVGPEIGVALLGLLTGVEPTHNDKRPARGDIHHRCQTVVIVFVHGCSFFQFALKSLIVGKIRSALASRSVWTARGPVLTATVKILAAAPARMPKGAFSTTMAS